MLKNAILTRIRFRGLAIIGLGVAATLLGLATSEPGAQGQSVGPDAVARVGGAPEVWGCLNGTQAYSTAGGVCNLGDAVLPGNSQNISDNHPMWTQNLYRLADNRFAQIGMNWVKHDDWVGSSQCGLLPCTPCTEAVPNCCGNSPFPGCLPTVPPLPVTLGVEL